MKLTIAGLGAIAALTVVGPAIAQTTCTVVDGEVQANRAFMYDTGQYDPAFITGNEPGSRVNLRNSIGANQDLTGYGLVGNFVWVAGQGFDTNCETWLYVVFPLTEARGWMHSNYIELAYGRGLWD